MLVKAAQDWLIAQGVEGLVVSVPRYQAVEQAFWRAMRAADVEDGFWMKL
jgi:hypothetical protein